MMKKKWCLTLFPTQAYAQDAEMSLSEFEDFVYAATFTDTKNPVAAWQALAKKQERLIRKLRGAHTDPHRRAGNRSLVLREGPRVHQLRRPSQHAVRRNLHRARSRTPPRATSVFDYPVCHAGREVDGIRLVFRKGKVVEATAEKNEKFLHTMLDMDNGARRLGEFGIGTNYGIQQFIKNILFDEKIGGSIHLAARPVLLRDRRPQPVRPALGHDQGPAPRRRDLRRRQGVPEGRQVRGIGRSLRS